MQVTAKLIFNQILGVSFVTLLGSKSLGQNYRCHILVGEPDEEGMLFYAGPVRTLDTRLAMTSYDSGLPICSVHLKANPMVCRVSVGIYKKGTAQGPASEEETTERATST